MSAKKVKTPRPPAGLSPEARRWWARLTADFDFGSADLLLLEELVRTLDRLREAQSQIKADGSVFRDRFGQIRPHPAVLLERDCRTSLVRYFRALRLDLDQLPTAGR